MSERREKWRAGEQREEEGAEVKRIRKERYSIECVHNIFMCSRLIKLKWMNQTVHQRKDDIFADKIGEHLYFVFFFLLLCSFDFISVFFSLPLSSFLQVYCICNSTKYCVSLWDPQFILIFFHTFVLFTPQCEKLNVDLHTFVPHESLFNNFISDFFLCAAVDARPITIFDRLFAFNIRICLTETGIPYAHSSNISELLSVHRFSPHPFTFYQLIDQQIRNFLHDFRFDKCELFFTAIACAMSSSKGRRFLIKISIGNFASAFMWMRTKCYTIQSNFASCIPFVIMLITFVMIWFWNICFPLVRTYFVDILPCLWEYVQTEGIIGVIDDVRTITVIPIYDLSMINDTITKVNFLSLQCARNEKSNKCQMPPSKSQLKDAHSSWIEAQEHSALSNYMIFAFHDKFH